MTGASGVEDLDLSDYVADYDTDLSALTWTIDSQSGFAGGTPTIDLTGSLLDVGGYGSATQGTLTLKADDGAENDSDDMEVKIMPIMMMGPSLTQDNNLTPPNVVPRSWVLQGDTALQTPSLYDLVEPLSARLSSSLSVCIADLDGNWLTGENATSVTYGSITASLPGLTPALSGAGILTLSSDISSVTEAYRVGVIASLDATTWDGMELLVSQARFPNNSDALTADRLDKFNNFEGVPTGDLPASQAAMRALDDADNPRWFKVSGTGTAKIVASAPTSATTTWASSGQALELSVNAAGDSVYIASEWFADIEPGETLTIAANVTSTKGADESVGSFALFAGNFHMPSNYSCLMLTRGSLATTEAMAMPKADDGSGWRRIKMSFTADDIGAAVDDGVGGTVDFYQRGYQVALVVDDYDGLTYPYTVYVDNIRIYKDKEDVQKALTPTELAVAGQSASLDTLFDGTFEGGTDLASLFWSRHPDTNQNDGSPSISTVAAYNHTPLDGSTNSFEDYLPGASTRGTTEPLVDYVYGRANLNASAAGGADNSGDGVYAMTAWVRTDATDVKDTPGLYMGLTDNRFRNIAFVDTGYVALPLDGTWKRVSVASERINAERVWPFVILRAEPAWITDGSPLIRSYWGTFGTFGSNPGYAAEGKIYVDDVEIHKIADDAMYFDASV